MSRKPLIHVVRSLVVKGLKTNAVGRWAYPFFQGCWRSVVIPLRRRRLRRHGGDCLKRLHEIMAESGIPYFCDYGTLLGIIRERAFIKTDDDVDVSILPGSAWTPVEVFRILKSRGYRFLHAFLYEGELREFTVYDRTGITIDVFFPTRTDDPLRRYCFEPIWDPSISYPCEKANTLHRFSFLTPTKLVETDFLGVTVVIPENAEAMLASIYSPSWRTPVREHRNAERIERIMPGFAYRVSEEEFLSFGDPGRTGK